MKKLLFILLVAGTFSCDSNKKVDDVESTENATGIQPGIQNVNGNIPDTSNSINLDNNKTDSGMVKDSLRK